MDSPPFPINFSFVLALEGGKYSKSLNIVELSRVDFYSMNPRGFPKSLFAPRTTQFVHYRFLEQFYFEFFVLIIIAEKSCCARTCCTTTTTFILVFQACV